MELNRDNKDIYTIDAKSYATQMHEEVEESGDFLGSFIKILLVILVLIFGYFFYKTVKADLSFSEVFNRQELLSFYALFNSDEEPKKIEKEDYVEVLAKEIKPVKSTAVLAVSKTIDKASSVKHTTDVKDVKVEMSVVKKEVKHKVKDNQEILSSEYLDLVTKGLDSI